MISKLAFKNDGDSKEYKIEKICDSIIYIIKWGSYLQKLAIAQSTSSNQGVIY